jgi:3-oxoadipate enol-lactonase
LQWIEEGEGPAVILIHGWALSRDYWDLALPLLARRFRVLRYDRRGFGRSTEQPDLSADVDDLLSLLKSADLGSVALVGMSQGARIAVEVALRAPAQVAALVLDGAPQMLASVEQELPIADYRKTLQQQGLSALQQHVMMHPLMQLANPGEAARAVFDRCISHYRGGDLLTAASASFRQSDPKDIAQPTLVISGERDSASRQQSAMALCHAIAGAQHQEIAGAGHLTALDGAADYAAALTRFLSPLLLPAMTS